jgi:tripartite-type tricarboxylate transporter receptor subunit TctC
MPDMQSGVYFGIVGPAGVPRPIVDKMNGMLRQIIKEPDVAKRFVDMGYITTGCTPEEYQAKIKFETERWSKVVKDNNIKIES